MTAQRVCQLILAALGGSVITLMAVFVWPLLVVLGVIVGVFVLVGVVFIAGGGE